jgi:hypothetical protein
MQRTLLGALVAFGLGAAVAAGCQQADDRPALIQVQCEAGANCHNPPPVGSGGSSSEAGGDAPGDASSTEVSGTVALLTSDDFDSAIAFTDTATIEMESVSGAPLTAFYDGASFTLEEVRVGTDLWGAVLPAPGDAMPTLQPLDTTQPSPLKLLVVPRSTLELVFGLLSAPTVPTDGNAQIVLQFRDATTLAPIEGVSVAHTAEAIAYDAGATYSDSETATGARGFAILVNVPAVTATTQQKLQITVGGTVGPLEVATRSNAVTLADVFIQP